MFFVCLVTESGLTLLQPHGLYSPSGSSVHGILQAVILKRVTISFSRDLPDPGIETASPATASGFFTTEPPGQPLCIIEQVNKGLYCFGLFFK